jgi:hypothetical protein
MKLRNDPSVRPAWIYLLAAFLLFALIFLWAALPLRTEAHVHTFIVNSTDDQEDYSWGDGDCNTMDPDGECTLRAALTEAWALWDSVYYPPADLDTHTIQVPAGTYYVYSNPGLGELGVAGNVIIEGAGQGSTIIMGQGGGVIYVGDGTTAVINDLTITNGIAGTGAGINNDGDLTLTDVDVTNNSATSTWGGGIRNSSQLVMTRVTVSGNQALQLGGGIFNDEGATLTILDSTISGNSVTDTDQAGGGIYNSSTGTVSIDRSTLSGNTAPFGGGMFNYGEAWLANVTLSGNSATTTSGSGGGAINNNGSATLDLKSVTIANNTTTTGQALVNVATLNIAHTIVANNTGGDCYFGVVPVNPVHHNLDSDGTCFTDIASNLWSTDPLLGALADNSGPTQTHALGAGSPAIDAGDSLNGCKSMGVLLTIDQRGWPRTVDGDVDGTAVCDIGAFEAPPPYQLWLPVILR